MGSRGQSPRLTQRVYNVRGPCRPPSPSSPRCSPRRGRSPRARCRPAPHHSDARAATADHRRPPGRSRVGHRATVGLVRAALSRRGRAADRAHHVRVLYDDKNVYIGIDAEQVNAPIVKRLARRDSQIASDGVWLDIDSRRTGVGAFHFGVNAAGMLSDGIHFDDTNYSSDWDAVWEAKVSDTDRGYTVEFRIPLAVLRFSALPVQDWGFQVRRFIDARQETDDWAFYPRSAATLRSAVRPHRQPARPAAAPSDRAAAVHPRAARVPHRRREHRADAWLVGGRVGRAGRQGPRQQRADAGPGAEPRLRPGRGGHGRPQPVDVRDALPREAPVLPRGHRRLLDGAAAGVHATHRQAAGDAEPDATRTAGRAAGPVPLYGAAKLVGTIGTRTSLGLISAITGPSDVEIDTGGVRTERRLEPWTTFNVLRLKRKLAANAEVGVLASAANRFETPMPVNTICPVLGVATPDGRCFNDAYVLSTDGRWRSGQGNYAVVWQALASTIQNGPERTQPDGRPIIPGLVAPGASLTSARRAARTGCGASGNTSRGSASSSTTLVTWNARTTTRPRWRSPTGRWIRGGITRETATALQVNVRRSLAGLTLWNEVKLVHSSAPPTSGVLPGPPPARALLRRPRDR